LGIKSDEPLLLEEEVIGFFEDKEVVFNQDTLLYLWGDKMIAYLEDGEIHRNENYVSPILLDIVWEHYMTLAFEARM